jgi:hypothetical protein
VCLTGRESEMDRQAIDHDRVTRVIHDEPAFAEGNVV